MNNKELTTPQVNGRQLYLYIKKIKLPNEFILFRPILYIPMLAIHMNRGYYKDGFNPNRESEIVPILATTFRAQLEGDLDNADDSVKKLLNISTSTRNSFFKYQ